MERTRNGGRSGDRGESSRGESRGSGRSSGRRFEYHKPDAESVKKRSEQKGGADFDSIFKEGVRVFKAHDGSNMIRPLPATWDGSKHFAYEIFVHYDIGADKQQYLCLKEMGKGDCPICEERARATKEGDDEYAKKLKPTKRFVFYLIDRDAEKEGVQAWAAPWTLDRDIAALMVDKRTGEVLGIDDPDNGYDVEFERTGKIPKIEYIGLQIARRESDLGNEAWLEYAVDNPIPSILQYYSYDYIANVFSGSGGKYESLDEDQEKGLRDMESRGRTKNTEPETPNYAWNQVHSMTYEELCGIVDEYQLDMVPDKSKNDDELADWVCEDLNIKEVKEVSRSSARSDVRGKLDSMRNRGD